MTNKLITVALVCAYFFSLFTFPGDDRVLDVNSWRLFLFSILNFLSLTFIFFESTLFQYFKEAIKSKVSIVIALYFLWALSSYFYAINPTEVLVRSTYIINFYISLIVFYAFLRFLNVSKNQIAIFFLISAIIHLFPSYSNYIEIVQVEPYNNNFNKEIMGFYFNRNITSINNLFHLQFILYLILNSKSVFIKVVSFLVSFLILYLTFILASRAAIILLLLLSSFYLLSFIIEKRNLKDILKTQFGILAVPLVFAFLLSVSNLGVDSNANPINRISSITVEEQSTNGRLRYYEQSSDLFFKSPLIGLGLGSWKIKSVDTDKENILSYVIPYTVHNDFLENAVELGLIGLILFMLIFYYPVKYSISNYFRSHDSFTLCLIAIMIIYIVDSNLNFPAIRASQLFFLAIFINLIYYKKNI